MLKYLALGKGKAGSGVRMDGLKTLIDLLHIKTTEVTTGKTIEIATAPQSPFY